LPWVGPEQRAGVGHNPYTLVFTVSGVAKAAGEVYAHWQAGWEVHESPVARRELLMVVPPITRSGMAAGQAMSLTASSPRVSFRGERSVAPMLGLVQMRNFEINDVQIEVWSGAAPLAWAVELPWSRTTLLALGATCLLIGLGSKYWKRTVPEPARRHEPPRTEQPCLNGVECVDAVAAHEIRVPAVPSHAARVFASLHQVLTVGLTVPTVADEARTRKRRAAS
jgi:hypothetical protein